MTTDKKEPLLSNLKQKRCIISLDDTIEVCIGDFGWTQFVQAILVSLAWVFDAQQSFISVFTDSHPTWHCISSSSSCQINKNICDLPNDTWHWDMPTRASIVSDWSLECSSSVITGLPASSFFVGCLVGGFLLCTLADSSFGRKNMLVLSCLIMSITGCITAFSTNIWMYSALRFLSGFGRATIGTCSLVLSTELVGRKWRGQVGIISFLCFTFGFISLPGIAFLNKGNSWRAVYLWTCIPAVVYTILVHFFVHESPRWLYLRGKKGEFVKTLKTIANPATRSKLTSSFFETLFTDLESNMSVLASQDLDLYSAIKLLIEKGWALRRLLTVVLIGFGVGMVYYGIPLGVGDLGFDIYLSITLNALSELPSSLIAFFLIGKMNRKGSLLGFSLLSGICSVGCALVEGSERLKWFQMGLEMLSFFSACTAFNFLLIYTLELFPTSVRNCAVSMVRQSLVVGGALSPLLVELGRNNSLFSYGIFGVCSATFGLLTVWLPETKGRLLCDTMDEEERLLDRNIDIPTSNSS
ncbi:organic cation/carnitine transporter 3-like [Lycium ferocissimum]|uniref:organic cation/carnitine transporter 3-like n=1 Tax=Lycium ferocissimum TaxID=112874 RepID=UPI0028152F70|nr:organic cation/carnitine transporter 3-like [Lycium ferocissimum]